MPAERTACRSVGNGLCAVPAAPTNGTARPRGCPPFPAVAGRWIALANALMAALAVHLVWPMPASAQLLDPVPFWKTDFSLDPTLAGVDPNGDGMPDWFIRGGQTFMAGVGNLARWRPIKAVASGITRRPTALAAPAMRCSTAPPPRRLPRLARSPVRRSLLGLLPPEEM